MATQLLDSLQEEKCPSAPSPAAAPAAEVKSPAAAAEAKSQVKPVLG